MSAPRKPKSKLNIGKIEEFILDDPTQRECVASNDSYISNNYTKQVVINFIEDEGSGLEKKWNARYPNNPCMIVRGEDFLEGKTNILFDEDDVIRIYIHAHGHAGSDFLSNLPAKGSKIHFELLAERLANLIGKHKAVINLASCEAGKTSNDQLKEDDSFAAKLHESLVSRMGENSPDVVARTSITVVNNEWGIWELGVKVTVDFDLTNERKKARALGHLRFEDYKHQQPGSKMIFYMNEEGEQSKRDAYSYKWKTKVINTIDESLEHTQEKDKEKFLQKQREQFPGMRPARIFEKISSEKAKSKYKQHSSSPWSPMRLFNSATYERMTPLIVEGQRRFNSKHTLKQPVPTGRRLNRNKSK
jgi:hypothetical protein